MRHTPIPRRLPTSFIAESSCAKLALALLITLCIAESASAQLGAPLVTNTRIRYLGSLLSEPGEPQPEEGDQIGVFFEDQLVGRYTFTQAQIDPLTFSLFANGDDPFTNGEIEGPQFGDPITFRFFDASTNFVRTDIVPVNSGGEIFNVVYEGQVGIDIPIIDLPDDLLYPTADPPFDLRLGIEPTNGGGDGGDGDGGGTPTPSGDPDVDDNGKINREDAALVIRIVTGSGRGIDSATRGRADVNGDGRVTSADAIAVLRASRGG